MVHYLDSFDHYNTTHEHRKWTDFGGFAPAIVPGAGTCGSQAMRISVFDEVTKGINFLSATVVVGHAVKIDSGLGSDNPTPIVELGTGFHNLLQLVRTTDGALSVIRDEGVSGVILGATLADVLRANIYTYIEFKAFIDNVGSVEVRVNGVPVLTLAGVDTFPATGTPAIPTRITFHGNDNESRDIDDLYALDDTGVKNDFLGPIRVRSLAPIGIGALQDWTLVGSKATHWQALDDGVAPDLDVSYITTQTAGQIDTQEFADTGLPSPGTVHAVQVNMLVRKTDAGYRGIKPVIRLGGTNYKGTEQSLEPEYAYKHQTWDENPAGGAWDITAVNALEAGIELSS